MRDEQAFSHLLIQSSPSQCQQGLLFVQKATPHAQLNLAGRLREPPRVPYACAMLVHVAGVAGSGKSTLKTELAARGHVAVDSDSGFCAWFDKSGNQVPNLGVKDRTPQWYRDHAWLLLPDKAEELAQACADRIGFLLGIFDDPSAVRERFAVSFYLTAPNAVIQDRLKMRDGDGYDTRFAVYGSAKKWQEYGEAYWTGKDYVPLDADRPPAEIADELLASVARSKSLRRVSPSG